MSEWQLLVRGNRLQVKELLDWMEREAKEPDSVGNESPDKATLLYTILESQEPVVDLGNDRLGVEFSDEETKCYPPWGDVVSDVLDKAKALGLDYAYGRLGENESDQEIVHNTARFKPRIVRVFGTPDWQD